MLRNLLVGLGILSSLSCGDIKENIPVRPKVICEYFDTNNNGNYDTYRLVRKSGDKSETIPGYLGSEFIPISFATQFDGWVRYRDVNRKTLEYMFKEYRYPSDADTIKFVEE